MAKLQVGQAELENCYPNSIHGNFKEEAKWNMKGKGKLC